LLLLLGFITLAAVSAQSMASEMETLLNNRAVTYAQAARFILQAADVPAQADAFQYAMEQKWLPKSVSANDTARVDRTALLVMRSFGIEGGLLYSVFKSPHHAFHELVYQNVIQGRLDPSAVLSGDVLLFILSRVFLQKEQEARQ
jgi:hypothetical protein